MAKPQEAKVLLGEAAEHLVLALRRGHVASQAPRAWKADDILGRHGLRIQVKATDQGKRQGWMVGNVEPDPQRFYAFVDFADETDPDVYIVPSCIVRDAAEKAYRESLRVYTGAGPSVIRKIQDPYPPKLKVPGYEEGWLKTYRDGWAQLGHGANLAPSATSPCTPGTEMTSAGTHCSPAAVGSSN